MGLGLNGKDVEKIDYTEKLAWSIRLRLVPEPRANLI